MPRTIDDIDRELSRAARAVSAGRAPSHVMAELDSLARERSSFMMPGIFERIRAEQAGSVQPGGRRARN